jgi:hypothetical protein
LADKLYCASHFPTIAVTYMERTVQCSNPSLWLISLLLIAVMAGCGGGGGGDSGSSSSSAASETLKASRPIAQPEIDVDLGSLQPAYLKQGLVHGLGGYSGPDATWDTANAYISALKPKSWRSSTLDVYNFVVRDYKYDSRFGTSIVINLQDIFNAKYGKPVTVASNCSPGQSGCFTSFDSLRQTWVGALEQILTGTSALHIDYFDLLAEPDVGSFVNVSPAQIYLLLKDAYGLVKTHRPDAKIVGPSNSGFSSSVYQNLLANLVTDNLHLDAISWHELGNDPDVISGHAETLRSLFAMFPQICIPSCPEIHINEYQWEDTMFIPGYSVAWLKQLEAAKIAQANRACWGGDPGSSISYDTCWYGFEGMLTPDNSSPQALYWVYKYYADLGGSRYSIQNPMPKIAAISGQLSNGGIGVLVGNYGVASAAFQVKLNRFQGSSARIDIYRLKNNLNQVVALPQVALFRSMKLDAVNSNLSIDMSGVLLGEAYWIVATPL